MFLVAMSLSNGEEDSENIAKEMVAIDDYANGWRHLVLPISFETEAVMDAVSAASAFHIASKHNAMVTTAQYLYTKAIQGLTRRQDFTKAGKDITSQNILALLVLLVSVMITGCSDFPVLYKILECALDSIGGEGALGTSDLAQFIRRQVRKCVQDCERLCVGRVLTASRFRVYGSVMVSEQMGIETIQKRALQTFECLEHCSIQHPEYAQATSNITNQIQQAFNIYLRRALGELDRSNSNLLVEHFIQTAEAYPKSCSSAEHALIWASFIVAAESSLPEHQQFFRDRLTAFNLGNGFSNILKGLEVLESVWRTTPHTRWTAIISQGHTFVM